MDDAPAELTGALVAQRYRVERLIGQGGMGSVWAGRHVTLGHLVAIKFIHAALTESREALRRFDTEAKAAARIKSRHAVTVHDHGVTPEGRPYIVMEHLEGEPLEAAIRNRGPLALKEIAAIVSQAARALEVAHAASVVHRDLKPDNIFLAKDREAGTAYTVKLVDFGIAKMLQDEAASGAAATQAGSVLGTPHYMSPEALTASGPVSAASDIWSLGACAFAAACARVPFEGDAIGDVVLKVCAAPMPVPSKLNPELPKAFDEWFARACSRDPKRRFTSVREMAQALSELDAWAAAQREQTAFEIRPTQPSSLDLELDEVRPAGRGVVLGGALAGAALMLGALGYYVIQKSQAADLAVNQTAASANALVEAHNLKVEGEFWERVNRADAGPDAGARPPRTPKGSSKVPSGSRSPGTDGIRPRQTEAAR
jgi:eukaryotic-like serine/threonine-protein kinase